MFPAVFAMDKTELGVVTRRLGAPRRSRFPSRFSASQLFNSEAQR